MCAANLQWICFIALLLLDFLSHMFLVFNVSDFTGFDPRGLKTIEDLERRGALLVKRIYLRLC